MPEMRGEVKVNIAVGAEMKVRTGLALHHLMAACRYASNVARVEREHAGQCFGEFWNEIFQDSLGVVILTVASLESYANEVWFEHAILREKLNETASVHLARLVDKESIIGKFSIATAICCGGELNLGALPAQNADILIRVRNEVVHFRPEWFSKQDRHDKLSKRLQGKFRPSPFLLNEPIFPRAWASADFVGWALRSAIGFLDHFYAEVGMPSPLDQFKPRLREMSDGLI